VPPNEIAIRTIPTKFTMRPISNKYSIIFLPYVQTF
jgi:hypothetical protein